MTIPKEIRTLFEEIPFMKWFILFFSFVCLLLAYVSVIYFGNDNIIEQKLEKIIEAEMGIKVDVSCIDGPTAPPPPEDPKGANGPAEPICSIICLEQNFLARSIRERWR